MHRLLLALLCLSLTLVACDKEQKPEVNWGNSGTTPTPSPTPSPTPHITPGKMSEANRRAALRIEMPLLTGDAAERFLVHHCYRHRYRFPTQLHRPLRHHGYTSNL